MAKTIKVQYTFKAPLAMMRQSGPCLGWLLPFSNGKPRTQHSPLPGNHVRPAPAASQRLTSTLAPQSTPAANSSSACGQFLERSVRSCEFVWQHCIAAAAAAP
jgi:hypothetical protein